MKKVLSLFFIMFVLSACSDLSLDELNSNVLNSIEEAKYCEVDEDCILLEDSCPFGCSIAINKNKELLLLALMDVYYERSLEEGLEHACEPCLLPGWAQCTRGVCETLYE